MNEDTKTTEANDSSIVTSEEVSATTSTEIDAEARITALEAEKARLIEEGANYKVAYLKERSKKQDYEDSDDEDLDEKIRRVTVETLANSRLAEIAQEQDSLIKKALKENRELKLAQLNKTNTPPASVGTHSEGQMVQDTLVTPEQMSAFKARGWSDKDIEKYKRNLQRYGGR